MHVDEAYFFEKQYSSVSLVYTKSLQVQDLTEKVAFAAKNRCVLTAKCIQEHVCKYVLWNL